MNLKHFRVRGFRRLKDVHVELDLETSIFVGANNSGKTSATQIFQLFLGDSSEKVSIYDFCADYWKEFDRLESINLQSEEVAVPAISLDLWFAITESDLHRVIELLPDLNWRNSLLGVRVEFSVKDAKQLLLRFREAKTKADDALKGKTQESRGYKPWPKSMTDYLSKCLDSEFDYRYFVLNHSQFDENFTEKENYAPVRLGDSNSSGYNIIRSLIRVDVLNAQRHLSDGNSSSGSSIGRAENLSRRLNRFYERNLEKRSDDFNALQALANSEDELNKHLSTVFESTLERLRTLGYPGFSNPHLVIKSALNPQTLLAQHTKIHYVLTDPNEPKRELSLPDKYNGLGFKNLIFMVIEILDFHSHWKEEKEGRALLHMVIIEEPEAHLHAQLQQVFIREIAKIIPKDGPDEGDFMTQMVVTTHSPHIIYERGFTPIRYFRRSDVVGTLQTSKVPNLSQFADMTKKETRAFLQRYMRLTHCDLFFADAAILVEGNVERLLLPSMIEKAAPSLQSCYLSILEVGGAFAHRFKSLVEFLGITTLIITDLDSVEERAGAVAEKIIALDNGDEFDSGKSCMTNEPGAITSNETLIQWLPKLKKISDLLAAADQAKVQAATLESPATVRVAYQTTETISWNGESAVIAGRTLEETFALENLEWCQHSDRKHLHLKVRATNKTTISEMAEKIYERIRSSHFNKTEFALNLMTEDPTAWKVPRYIEAGLHWLKDTIVPKEIEPAKKAQRT